MKRINTFKIIFKHLEIVMGRAEGCAVLWNKLNYRRRQSFFNKGKIDWESKDLYDEFKGWIGSTTSQQIIRKNQYAWNSFIKLIHLKAKGKLPSSIRKVRPPGYWKDRDTEQLKLIYIVRCDSYRIDGRRIHLPFKLKGRIKGKPKWNGKQGELEIIYDGKHWIAHQSVETEPLTQPSGQSKAFVDIGVKCPIAAVIQGRDKPIVYSGSEMLSDWWYWNKRIRKCMSELKKVNDKYTSRKLSKLYRTRTRRHRDAVNKIVHGFIQECVQYGVDEIFAGDLTGIRDSGSMGKKTNSMVNNYWSHKYLMDRLQTTAENYGIAITLVDEAYTSSICPRCNSMSITKRGRLFKCKDCGIELHRDVVGSVNISIAEKGCNNWLMAQPQVVNDFSSFHSSNLERISTI